MKKISLFFALLISLQTNLLSQVKNYIPIVKPVLYESTKETFEKIANKFEQRNHQELAEIFRSFAQGGHGSGFVFVDSDGENYIITNRHVVANSEYVNLEFSGKGSVKTVYEACPIIYTDNNIDLAVVKFPNNEKIFDKSFTLSTNKQLDGAEIWSAGFPGLLGKPMWQFAKGNITNEEAYVDELVSADISYLIQHSASIDPGNSGGPILVKDEKIADGYSVIGINTWTITNRQNTFFSIPSKNIPKLIEKAKATNALKHENDKIKSILVEQAKIFAAEVNTEKPKWSQVMNFISYSYVGKNGWDNFLKLIEEGDAETLKEVNKKFFEYSPMEAMRFSILYRMWKKLYNNNKLTIEFKGINAADEAQIETAKTVRTIFLINGKEQEMEWAFEHGHWRINQYNFEKLNNNTSESFYGSDDDDEVSYRKKKSYEGTPVYIGLDMFFTPYSQTFTSTLNDNFNLMGYGGTFTINFQDRSAIYTRVNWLNLNNDMKNPPENLTSASVKYLHINHGFALYVGRNKLRPYFLFGFNYLKFHETGSTNSASITNKYGMLGLQLGTGLKYKFNKRIGIFAEATYNGSSVVPAFLESSYYGDLSNFQTSIGISIDFKKK